MSSECNHNHKYLFDGKARCLHQLFKQKAIKAITKEKYYGKVEFNIWPEKLYKYKRGRWAGRYNLNGTRSKLHNKDQIILAIELAKKYNIQRIVI